MDKIISIADKYNLYLVEDAAPAFGASYKGAKSGSFGHISAFSMNPMKVFKPTAILRLKIGRPSVAKDASLRPTREMASEVTTEIMIRIAKLLPEDQRGAYSDLIDIKPTQTVII